MFSGFANSYAEMIGNRVARAARKAAGRGFGVEISGSLLNLHNDWSSASLLFRSDHIVLEHLSVDTSQRRHRFGSALLALVTAIADEANLRLELIAESPLRPSQHDLSQRDLQAWYRRHRFVDDDAVMMVRLPDRAA
jgi:ribosomal protein S18 acetylase RimI-like enzyme